jgi:DNA-binding LytR/AlgR family response regulator
MINVILIEDDTNIANQVVDTLRKIPQVHVKNILHTVKEALEYIKGNYSFADLIISDIQLKDGLCFNIFEQLDFFPPIIFLTDQDQYVQDVFRFNSIDYLPKPLNEEQVVMAVDKYRRVEETFFEKIIYKKLGGLYKANAKTKVIGKRGTENVILDIADVVLFYKESKLVLIIDKDEKKYIVEGATLSELEQDFKLSGFFRVNRQYLVNVKYIKSYKSFERVKLLVSLSISPFKNLVVSQENSKAFKQWISGA